MGTIKKVNQTATQNPPAQPQGTSSTTPAKKSKTQVRPQPGMVKQILPDAYLKFDQQMKLRRQADIERITQKYWDDSPEFAREFLVAAVRTIRQADPKVKAKIKWPILTARIKRAILNLIPEDAGPPPNRYHLDASHESVVDAIVTVMWFSPYPGRVKFLRELAEERPRYKEFFCHVSLIPREMGLAACLNIIEGAPMPTKKVDAEPKAKPADYVAAEGHEKDIIQQLIETISWGYISDRDLVIRTIAENYWSDSLEFAEAFLFATVRSNNLNEKIQSLMNRAIFNLLPKDKDPTQVSDRAQRVVQAALASLMVRVRMPSIRGIVGKDREWWNQFLQKLIEQRPLFKDLFGKYLIR